MKIAIPVDENKDTVCVAFARAPYFCVYDLNTDKKEFLTNPASSAQGGAGIKASQFIVDLGVDALVTVRLGENSAEVLKEANIKIFKSCAISIKANVEAVKNGTIAPLLEFHAGYHGRK